MNTYVITPAAGKRLIAKAMAQHPAVQSALTSGTLVIVAGTTNGLVAEEILAQQGIAESLNRAGFMRGVTVPPSRRSDETGRLTEKAPFPGDVVITQGEWRQGQTIFDVAEMLGEGDIILKGANALDLISRRAAVLVGHPQGGTAIAAIQAHIGRRVGLILPVGLEKRVSDDLDHLAGLLNVSGAKGPRLLPLPGEVFTEVEAIELLTGATADLVAAGGVYGAEGSVWLGVSGDPEHEKAAQNLIDLVADEPAFTF